MLLRMASRPRRRLPRAEREERMLDAALDIFTARGFEAASMDEIAAASGITKPMLYSYFGSKEGLYLACIDRAARPMIAALRGAVVVEDDPARRLWAGARAYLGWVDGHREIWARFFLEAYARGGAPAARVEQLNRELGDTLAELFVGTARAAGVAPLAEVEAMSVCLGGATQAMGRWWLDHPEVPADLVALRVVNFAWRGLEQLMHGNLWLPPPDTD
jgi:AcrR family transcriptional regulator